MEMLSEGLLLASEILLLDREHRASTLGPHIMLQLSWKATFLNHRVIAEISLAI